MGAAATAVGINIVPQAGVLRLFVWRSFLSSAQWQSMATLLKSSFTVEHASTTVALGCKAPSWESSNGH